MHRVSMSDVYEMLKSISHTYNKELKLPPAVNYYWILRSVIFDNENLNTEYQYVRS